MRDESKSGKAYSAPKLVQFGAMAKFTKGGTGSITEASANNKANNFRQ
jgi:hypothetical protein